MEAYAGSLGSSEGDPIEYDPFVPETRQRTNGQSTEEIELLNSYDKHREKEERKAAKKAAKAAGNATAESPAEETPAQELTVEEQLANMLAEAQQMVNEEKDRYLRLAAEFDNYRKRTLKEKAELIKNGAEKTLTAILPVLDDFERALKNIEATNDETKALKEGVELIANKLNKVLGQEGLQKIETEGKDFDVDFHEAIALIPAPSEDLKGKILDCVQTGYMLNEKVIRHSKVAVAQ
jgi:molecular chaperone GrpE